MEEESAADVALRKESVDRNLYYQDNKNHPHGVALRKESVDRNLHFATLKFVNPYVALRKESVDRNKMPIIPNHTSFSRSPQGERG